MRTRPVGHDFRDQRDAHCELAADAKAGQETVRGKIPDAKREGTKPRKYRVQKDCQNHRASPAKTIAHYPKNDPARGPADHEYHGGDAAPYLDPIIAG